MPLTSGVSRVNECWRQLDAEYPVESDADASEIFNALARLSEGNSKASCIAGLAERIQGEKMVELFSLLADAYEGKSLPAQ